MNLLLDTHAVLWLLDGDDRVPPWLRTVSSESDHGLIVSDVSLWEIAIKTSLGRLEVPGDLPKHLDAAGLSGLAIKRSHIWRVRELDVHHKDPFDRLLVAQALEEDLTLVSSERDLSAYGISLI